jgi:pilus assembly protein CpaF
MTAHFGHRSQFPKPAAGAEARFGSSTAGATAETPRAFLRDAPEPRPFVPSAPPADKARARVPGNEVDLLHSREVIRDLVLSRLDPVAATRSTPADLEVALKQMVGEAASEHGALLNNEEQTVATQELMNDIIGLGPLEPLLQNDENTDILVNGAGQVFVEQHGRLKLTDVKFRSDAHVQHVAQRIAASVGRRVDAASPMLDARLPDGSRVNVIFPPASVDGPCISIRKFSRDSLSFDKMIAYHSVSPKLARFLEIVTSCRLNIIISGGTGSGKTTLLGAMSRYIDRGERVITIEDSAELQLQMPHRIRLETRPASIEGDGEISQRDLVKNALRMRPDRIIVGEVRGAEAFDMLQAMNTGHSGSMSTVHANSPRDALTRIENMVLMATANLPSRAIISQIVGALQLVVQVERMRDGTRRVTEVSEILSYQDDTVTMATLFSFVYHGEHEDGLLQGEFLASNFRPHFLPRIAYYGLVDALLETMTPD